MGAGRLAGVDKPVAWFFRIAIEEREIDHREFLTGSGGPIALASSEPESGRCYLPATGVSREFCNTRSTGCWEIPRSGITFRECGKQSAARKVFLFLGLVRAKASILMIRPLTFLDPDFTSQLAEILQPTAGNPTSHGVNAGRYRCKWQFPQLICLETQSCRQRNY